MIKENPLCLIPASINAVKSSNHYFTGVPITAGGGLLTLLTLFQGKMPEIILPIAFFIICYLMVSTIKIPSLKDVPLPKYGIIVTLFLGYAIYLVFKKEQYRFPYFIYVAIPLYIAFIIFQLVRRKRKNNGGIKK
ncbi:hypothetical protein V7659_22835 [Neobacillus drentensis]|uniref:hypothetical protein n=1 Tax=Neobacillus drentensis TaxID=220684 RepID=UPI003000DD43